jgi:hypothetical protein
VWQEWFAEQADTSRKLLLSRVQTTKDHGEKGEEEVTSKRRDSRRESLREVRRGSKMGGVEISGDAGDGSEDEMDNAGADPGVDRWVIDAPLVASICVGFDVESTQDALRRYCTLLHYTHTLY